MCNGCIVLKLSLCLISMNTFALSTPHWRVVCWWQYQICAFRSNITSKSLIWQYRHLAARQVMVGFMQVLRDPPWNSGGAANVIKLQAEAAQLSAVTERLYNRF